MLPLRSYWPALLPPAQEVCCPHHPVDLAPLERCSCLCSESIPSVTKKSVIFMEELSFPQTTPTDDAFFQLELGWSVWGSLGRTKTADGLNWRTLDRLGWDRIAAMLVYRPWMRYSPARRTRRKKGRRGLRLWPLRCLSQILSERKERRLRLLSIGVPLTGRMPMYL